MFRNLKSYTGSMSMDSGDSLLVVVACSETKSERLCMLQVYSYLPDIKDLKTAHVHCQSLCCDDDRPKSRLALCL